MSNNIFNNTTSLQDVLEALQNKAAGGGGLDTSDATATAADIMLNETAYIADGKVTGTFTIQNEINDINTRINNIKTALEGKASGTEANLQEKTVTPSSSNQTITADSGYDGLSSVIVQGDSNLIAENIKAGVTIFDIDGNYGGSSSGGVSTAEVNVRLSMLEPGVMCYYCDGALQSFMLSKTGKNINCMVPSIVVIQYASASSPSLTGGITTIFSQPSSVHCFYVSGSGTITL